MIRLLLIAGAVAALSACASTDTAGSAGSTASTKTAARMDCEHREPPLGSNVKRRDCVPLASDEARAHQVQALKDAIQPVQIQAPGWGSTK